MAKQDLRLDEAMSRAAKMWEKTYLRRNHVTGLYQVGYWHIEEDGHKSFYIVGVGTSWAEAVTKAEENHKSNHLAARESIDV